MSEESEFGKGLIICLIKFAEHSGRWNTDKEMWIQLGKDKPDLFNESYAVEMHFNGASDHLYEIEVPEKWKNTEIGMKVKELQDKGLTIGHRYTGRNWQEKDVHELYDLAQEIALLIDKELGLEPQKGRW